jgi:hypothetical protein
LLLLLLLPELEVPATSDVPTFFCDDDVDAGRLGSNEGSVLLLVFLLLVGRLALSSCLGGYVPRFSSVRRKWAYVRILGRRENLGTGLSWS